MYIMLNIYIYINKDTRKEQLWNRFASDSMPSARGSSTDQSIAPSTDNDTANRSDVKEQICAGGLRDPHWRIVRPQRICTITPR